MERAFIEGIVDSYHRLHKAVAKVATVEAERAMTPNNFRVFKDYASLSSFEVDEESGKIIADFTYFHPYEGEESLVIDPKDIDLF
jgi:CRISPR/Cas system Type II protein with McrA/HNH and RuvC-like nuclease domain